MNHIIDYINSLPVYESTKWVAMMIAYADRKIVTQDFLCNQSGLSKRTIRHHLYKLIDCGVISRRILRGGRPNHYWISDTRMIHHIAAEKNGFEPIGQKED